MSGKEYLIARPRWLLVLLASSVLTSCAESTPVPPDAVAHLDDQPLPYSRFQHYLDTNLDAGDESAPILDDVVVSRLFDQFLEEQLLVQLAVDRGFALAVDDVDHRAAIDYLLHDAFAKGIDRKSIADYYETHRERWTRPPQVRLWQILVPDRAMIDQVVAALRRGETFEDLARRWAENPEAGFCGEQGPLAREDLPADFGNAIFALAPGEISDVLTTDYGFYLFKVVERLPRREPSLAEVEGEIRDALLRQRMAERMTELLAEAQTRYDVRVFTSNLPFDYRGSYAEQENDA